MRTIPDPAVSPAVRALVRRAVAEDRGRGDVTTSALIPPTSRTRAVILARRPCVVSGLSVARLVFQAVDRRIRFQALLRDGARARPGRAFVRLEGPTAGILTAERTALNFLQRMSGIATLTAEFVRRAGPRGPAILDTRKTAPNLRLLDKYAVRCGGGRNHRFGLYDMALIKDNHRAAWGGLSLAAAVMRVRRDFPNLPIEIEVESQAQLREALLGEPDWILLDNMTPERLRKCVRIAAGRCKLEASGGVTLDTVRRIAATGVDAISVGALTHSVRAADLSLEFVVHPGCSGASVKRRG